MSTDIFFIQFSVLEQTCDISSPTKSHVHERLLKNHTVHNGSAKFTPRVDEDNVRWVPDRMQLRTRHWDSKKRKFTITSMNAEFEAHWDEVEKQEQVNKKARQLQEQYEEKHDTLNNMPRDESVESASDTDERPAKKRKTGD